MDHLELPPAFYTVVTKFGDLGLGTAGDATSDWSQAYDQYSGIVIGDGVEPRVFMLRFGSDNTLAGADEVTGEFAAELERVCERRGLPDPFDTTPTPDEIAAARADDAREMRLCDERNVA